MMADAIKTGAAPETMRCFPSTHENMRGQRRGASSWLYCIAPAPAGERHLVVPATSTHLDPQVSSAACLYLCDCFCCAGDLRPSAGSAC